MGSSDVGVVSGDDHGGEANAAPERSTGTSVMLAPSTQALFEYSVPTLTSVQMSKGDSIKSSTLFRKAPLVKSSVSS